MKTITLITGSNKGMGFEAARQLAKQDIHVLIGARNAEKGQAAVKSLTDEGLSAEFLLLDVTDEESVKNAVQAVAKQHGKLDILINNAGINPEYAREIFTFEELPLDLMKQIYQTNVFGAFLAIREFLPLLRKSTAGRIVNVSSSVGSLTDQSNPESPYYGINTVAYNTSKTALNALTVQLAKQLSDTTIKVNSICPGWVKTDLGSEAAPRTVDEGVRIIVRLATLGEDGASGGFFNEDGVIPW
ncbi:MAG: SDR family oxidoreductase [Pleurocapsa sp. MO_226.B13]|nr:SDR family oxidoreductase [Pleurocapsa sp. MO_226.B13]